MEITSTIFVSLGAIVASLIAGLFSFFHLVSSKENKVSEFRLNWIEGLRNEISTYTSAIQALVRLKDLEQEINDPKEWVRFSEQPYRNAIESISRIQLRLNPVHAEEDANSPEAILMREILKSRNLVNEGKYDKALASSVDIRKAAAPLLKAEWERVKSGEPGYRAIRNSAFRTIKWGIFLIGLLVVLAVILSFFSTD